MFRVGGQPVQRSGSVVAPSAMVEDGSRWDRRGSYGMPYLTLVHYNGAYQDVTIPLIYRVFGHC